MYISTFYWRLGTAYRLQAIATPLVPNMEKVQIIPPPKEVDPRVLAWKGGAVLGKMDGVSELWVTAPDWVCIWLMPRCVIDVDCLPFKGYSWDAWIERTVLLPID